MSFIRACMLLLIALFNVFQLTAQTQIEWKSDPVFLDDNYFISSKLGVQNNAVYYLSTKMNRNGGTGIIGFNLKDFHAIAERPLAIPEKAKVMSLVGINMNGDKKVLFAELVEKHEATIKGYIMNDKGEVVTEGKTIFSYKKDRPYVWKLFGSNDEEEYVAKASLISSEDSSKIAVIVDDVNGDKEDASFNIAVFDLSSLDLIWKDRVIIPEQTKNLRVLQYALSNTGDVSFIVKKHFTAKEKKNTENEEKEGVYIAHYAYNDKKMYNFKLIEGDQEYKSLTKFKKPGSDNIALVYISDDEDDGDGIQYAEYSPSEKKVVSSFKIPLKASNIKYCSKAVANLKDDVLKGGFSVNSIFWGSDNSVYFVLLNFKTKVTYDRRTGRVLDYHYYTYGDVVINASETGEFKWGVYNPRDADSHKEFLGIMPYYCFNKDNVYILHNDHLINDSRTFDQLPGNYDNGLGATKRVISCKKISKDGEMKRFTVEPAQKKSLMLIANGCMSLGDGKLLIMGSSTYARPANGVAFGYLTLP